MASETSAKCADCGFEWTFMMGGLWSAIQTVCDDCGSQGLIPRLAPVDAPVRMDEAYLIWLLQPAQGKLWVERGRCFETAEWHALNRLTRQCDCGGYRRRDHERGVRYRCPQCNGASLALTPTGILWD